MEKDRIKVFVASFNRASNGTIEKLVHTLKQEKMYAENYRLSTHVLAVGDRTETYDFILKTFRDNKPIIHLWAGEISQGCHDEVYRHSMTLMSMLQLCSNETAKNRTEALCKSVDKKSNAYIIGNLPLDDLSTDESSVPTEPYLLVLYNPPTLLSEKEVKEEISETNRLVSFYEHSYGIKKHIWIEPNGDRYSDLVTPYVNQKNLPRKQFLGLMKNCEYFITNSSCMYYESPFLLKPVQIIPVGIRNVQRESKYSDMNISGATEKIIEILGKIK